MHILKILFNKKNKLSSTESTKKSNELLNSKEKIEQWLKKMNINHYVINNDLTVHVNGSVNICDKKLNFIPIQFDTIKGDFDCSYNNLTSLKGAPYTVNGDFDCSYNNLTSLQNSPNLILGNFNCIKNKLISLEGCPSITNGHFFCNYNEINTLLGSPKTIHGNFICIGNLITSMEGSPEHIKGIFNLCANPILHLNLDNLPQYVGKEISFRHPESLKINHLEKLYIQEAQEDKKKSLLNITLSQIITIFEKDILLKENKNIRLAPNKKSSLKI